MYFRGKKIEGGEEKHLEDSFIWNGFLKVKEAWSRKCKIKLWVDMLLLVAVPSASTCSPVTDLAVPEKILPLL